MFHQDCNTHLEPLLTLYYLEVKQNNINENHKNVKNTENSKGFKAIINKSFL